MWVHETNILSVLGFSLCFRNQLNRDSGLISLWLPVFKSMPLNKHIDISVIYPTELRKWKPVYSEPTLQQKYNLFSVTQKYIKWCIGRHVNCWYMFFKIIGQIQTMILYNQRIKSVLQHHLCSFDLFKHKCKLFLECYANHLSGFGSRSKWQGTCLTETKSWLWVQAINFFSINRGNFKVI